MATGLSGNSKRVKMGMLLGGVILFGAACQESKVSLAATGKQVVGSPGQGQPVYASDDAAFQALLVAVRDANHDEVHRILGPAWKELMSGDKVEDANAFKEFVQRAGEKTRLEKVDDWTSVVHVGNDDWPFPIPLARMENGKWYFDTEAGKSEVLARRIGNNELEAIAVCGKIVRAEKAYESKDRDGSGVMKYAQRIISTAGKKDGLYWNANEGQEESPLGHLFEKAATQGYQQANGASHDPFHGYLYRVLKEQGAAAPGGKMDYVVNGNMTKGFAVVAFPADYESSGIMTFIVNQDGKVYQKDLGVKTVEMARKMTEFNPDSGWTEVKE